MSRSSPRRSPRRLAAAAERDAAALLEQANSGQPLLVAARADDAEEVSLDGEKMAATRVVLLEPRSRRTLLVSLCGCAPKPPSRQKINTKNQKFVVFALCVLTPRAVNRPWRTTPLRIGASVALLCARTAPRPARAIVDAAHGALSLAPSHLIAASRIAGAALCARRALLDELSARSTPSASATAGHIAHELFQATLGRGGNEAEATERVRKAYLASLYAAQMSDSDAARVLSAAAAQSADFRARVLILFLPFPLFISNLF